MKRMIRAVPGIILAVCLLWSTAGADGMQACHRVTNAAETTTLENKAQIELWHVETALPEVTDEINGLAEAWAEDVGVRERCVVQFLKAVLKGFGLENLKTQLHREAGQNVDYRGRAHAVSEN